MTIPTPTPADQAADIARHASRAAAAEAATWCTSRATIDAIADAAHRAVYETAIDVIDAAAARNVDRSAYYAAVERANTARQECVEAFNSAKTDFDRLHAASLEEKWIALRDVADSLA